MSINKIYDFSFYKKSKNFKENNYKERFLKFTTFDWVDFVIVPNLCYDFELELTQNEQLLKHFSLIKSLLSLDPQKRIINWQFWFIMGDAISKLVFKTGYENIPEPPPDLWSVKMNDIEGKPVDFETFKEKYKAFLIVNVASRWGFTDENYKELVRLDETFGPKGLKIIGVPSRQFMNQEFSCDADIAAFAKRQGAKFQIMQLSDVNGPNTIPLYSYLRSRILKGSLNKVKMVPWNFTKFILDAQGIPLKMFGPTDKSELIISELERLCQWDQLIANNRWDF